MSPKKKEVRTTMSRIAPGVAAFVICAAFFSGIVWLMGSNNPYTPPGYVGYVYQKSIFGKAQFLGVQKGPTSYGRTWLAHVVNVSITPYTYDEAFTVANNSAVLAKDNLRVEFAVHLLWQVDEDNVRQLIEKYSTMAEDETSDKVVRTAYDNFLKEPLRTFTRDEIQKFDGLQIKNNISEIGKEIHNRMLAIAKGTPFKLNTTVVGTIQYPDAVATQVASKLAATQRLEQQQTEASIRITEAGGIAGAMAKIKKELTPEYLQYQAIEAQKMQVNSPNHTVIYIPVGPLGVPIVNTIDPTKADKK
jgi:hypothetical protein